MFLIIFLLSAAYLAHNLYHAIKGTAPGWMQNRLYALRNEGTIKDAHRKTETPIGSLAKIYSVSLLIATFIVLTYIIGWPNMAKAVWLLMLVFFASVAVALYMVRNFNKWVVYYTDHVAQEEKKQEIRAAHGAKGWASQDQIKRSLNNVEKRLDNGELAFSLHVGSSFFWNGQGHILTVGGSRGGKGVNLILPALLSYANAVSDAASFVVLDPKGENLAVAGDYLKKCGYNVLAINPFSIPEIATFGNARFNPFDLFSENDPDFDKYADMIAFALVPPTKAADAFWDNSARGYISLYIRHMMTQSEEPKTFRTLYKWLRLAGEDRVLLLSKMTQSNAFDGDVKDEASAIFGQLINDGEKTVESVYATVRTATDVFKDMQLRESVSGSDIDIKSAAWQKTAIFVCLNPSDLERCQVWLRLFFGSVMRGLTKNYNPHRRVILLMDEFPTLGTLKEFEQAAGFLAGYNVTLWPVMQDLTQLKNLYPNSWETFVNNAIVRHYLAIGDNFTADYISKRMPKDIRFVGNNADGSPREIQKPLLEPAEVMAFPGIIMEVKGMDRPADLKKQPYWELSDNGSPNPFRG